MPARTPAAARTGQWGWVLAVVAVLAVLIVVVGLVVWAPWSGRTPATPASVHAASPTPPSVVLQWPRSRKGPSVDAYVIRRNGVQVGFVAGSATSYQDRGVAPATSYRYSIVAVAGGLRSAPSPALVVTTRTPPTSAARLQGSWTVTGRVVKSGGGSLKVGATRVDPWQFRPACAAGPCTVVLSGAQGGSRYPHPFTVTLNRAGAVYTGTTKAHLTHCGESKGVKDVTNTVTLRLTVRTAGVDKSAWVAGSWTGTMTIFSPYTSAGGGWYCPAQSVTSTFSASR